MYNTTPDFIFISECLNPCSVLSGEEMDYMKTHSCGCEAKCFSPLTLL